jgi:DNA-directed RNA polymerase specialized sigma24 family protein
MTMAERPRDYNEEVNHFLKLHGKELEFRALKLTRCYNIDFHDLLSLTAETVWQKWPDELCTLPDDKQGKRATQILFNHARNLSKGTRRRGRKLLLVSSSELERLTHAITSHEDPVAVNAIFQDERFKIYRAICRLRGRSKEVMTLLALGLEDSEIRDQLEISEGNLRTIKSRACKSLLLSLGLEEKTGEDRGGKQR